MLGPSLRMRKKLEYPPPLGLMVDTCNYNLNLTKELITRWRHMRYNLNLMRNLIAQRLRMQPELNSRKKAFAHMLYMRLKLKFYQKNLRAHGQHMCLN